MKRLRLIMLLGLLGAAVAYGVGYVWRLRLAGGVSSSALDELGWLKQEFRLSDAEFARVQSLHATYLLGMKIWEEGFSFYKMGYASAVSWILMMIILALTVFVFRSSSYWVFYEDDSKL